MGRKRQAQRPETQRNEPAGMDSTGFAPAFSVLKGIGPVLAAALKNDPILAVLGFLGFLGTVAIMTFLLCFTFVGGPPT